MVWIKKKKKCLTSSAGIAIEYLILCEPKMACFVMWRSNELVLYGWLKLTWFQCYRTLLDFSVGIGIDFVFVSLPKMTWFSVLIEITLFSFRGMKIELNLKRNWLHFSGGWNLTWFLCGWSNYTWSVGWLSKLTWFQCGRSNLTCVKFWDQKWPSFFEGIENDIVSVSGSIINTW